MPLNFNGWNLSQMAHHFFLFHYILSTSIVGESGVISLVVILILRLSWNERIIGFFESKFCLTNSYHNTQWFFTFIQATIFVPNHPLTSMFARIYSIFPALKHYFIVSGMKQIPTTWNPRIEKKLLEGTVMEPISSWLLSPQDHGSTGNIGSFQSIDINYLFIQNNVDDWIPANGALGAEERQRWHRRRDVQSGHLDKADDGVGKPGDQEGGDHSDDHHGRALLLLPGTALWRYIHEGLWVLKRDTQENHWAQYMCIWAHYWSLITGQT